ncbi:MAG: hypothetical protein BWY78_00815 [Alphaproteobacteria bacterium ADurb.Bin438]|nr:MAG: hypothetical protein BWY78_00815 [Alphaproteobacteria bacterium ADurb.Bin438]
MLNLLKAFVVVVIFLFSYEIKAQENDDAFYDELRNKRLNVPDTQKYMNYLKDTLLKMKTMSDEEIEEAKTEEYWLKRISKIPPEYMQYYAPALFHNSAVPKSVLEKPYIKKYKDKLPTDIAPEVKDIVEKYGKDISPDYYYLLMPEAYEKFNKKPKPEVESPEIVKEFRIKKGEDASSIFSVVKPTEFIQEKLKLIEEKKSFVEGNISINKNKIINSDTKLTNQDVLDFITTIPDLRMVVESKENFDKMNVTYGYFDKNLNPCENFFKRVEKANLKEKISEVIKKHDYDEESFKNICARIFEISKYSEVNLDKAINVYNYSVVSTLLKKDNKKYNINIDDYIAFLPYKKVFYLSLKEDMFLIGPYKK